MARTKETSTKETKQKETSAKETKPKATGKIRIQYYRSAISTPVKHKLVVKGLGFTRLNQIVERVDNNSVRGMVKAIPHLVRIVES